MSQSYTSQRHPHLPEVELPHEIPPADEPFSTLVAVTDDRKTDPLDVYRTLREGIEALPETASTFRLPRVIDDSVVIDAVEPEHLALCGAWHVPDRIAGASSNRGRYVNPFSPSSWQFSDVYTTCSCGALVSAVDSNVVGDAARLPARTEHTDDCPRIDRWRSRYELLEARYHLAIRLLRYGHRTTEIGHRLGYRQNRPGSRMSTALGIDTSAQREVFEKRFALTAVELLPTHAPEEIGEAFGYSSKWVKEHVRKYTDANMRSFAMTRRHARNRGEL